MNRIPFHPMLTLPETFMKKRWYWKKSLCIIFVHLIERDMPIFGGCIYPWQYVSRWSWSGTKIRQLINRNKCRIHKIASVAIFGEERRTGSEPLGTGIAGEREKETYSLANDIIALAVREGAGSRHQNLSRGPETPWPDLPWPQMTSSTRLPENTISIWMSKLEKNTYGKWLSILYLFANSFGVYFSDPGS